ncbi:MAG: HAMP domain-containing sensor histidine kinase [Reichenbachiella sp.]|uniref:sensor histidine kinase n=1 Tax=Reichenbachiella sp. TaxID=2184521 RepID=UPI0029664690|nr:HAMP domain-containing sensor histidine kinase [Reichenbachiella sp.]MDW3212271.1 HAMP domain-containing sensor histidine kinase [Reichenbachiella sp.]
MNKLAIRGLILAMGLALVGLVVFQVYWIESIISANEEAFKRDVQDALTSVAQKLEKKEAMIVAVDNFHTNFAFKSPSESDSNQYELIESTFEKKVIQVQDYAKDSSRRPEWLSFYFDSEKNDPKLKNVSITLTETPSDDSDEEIFIKEGEVDSIITNNIEYQKRLKRIAKKSEYVQLAMHELFAGVKSLNSRIDAQEADSLLKSSLQDRGIELPFDFGIFDPLEERFTIEQIADSRSELQSSDLRASLFPNDIMGAAGYLVVRFPDQQTYLLGKIWVTLVSSLIFIVIILVCFSFAIHTIFRQKKLSEIKSDFINNMTHEFKTPISTVSLACEALRDDQIRNTEGLSERYLGIIHDENKRLGLQVEKVLQMAVIERNDFKLKLEQVNVHEIIEKALANIQIQVTSKGGQISTDLLAINQTITADQMHLTNIVYNLLDNANKYSADKPAIKIMTIDHAKGIMIKIIDKGIGMSKEVVNKIFEKFYRIPTGNLHDVKGFGLGLAYVKNMVEAHGGNIQVKSELKKGSEFTVFLPYQLNKE